MYRFFVEPNQIADGYVTITGDDVNHICHVLRMKLGEEIRISNGVDKDYYCIIRELAPQFVRAQVCYEEHQATELPARIHLYQGLPKGDKM
jgi:16S rRNA (uracil1498-N3)-methyltransferase